LEKKQEAAWTIDQQEALVTLSPLAAPALRHRPSFFSTERDAQGATSMAFGFDGVYEEPENTALYRQHVKKVRTPSLLPRPWRSASTACTRSRRTPRLPPACQEGKHAPTTGAPAANLPIQQGAVCRTPARFQQHQVEYWCSGVCSDNALGCVS
jgi:hypothetical protein